MKKTLLSFCLPLALSFAMPLTALAQTPAAVAVAPAISANSLQQLSWLPVMPPVSQDIVLNANSPQLAQGDIQGAVAAISLPADRGSLDIQISSIAADNQLFMPSVLVLDEQLRPAAYYPSSAFPYQPPGIMAADRLEGKLKLTPALGQKQIHLLIYTTRQDLATSTTLTNPAKAYAKGTGNAVPNIPDPVARHTPTGLLKLKVTAEQASGNVMIGILQPAAPAATPQIVGSTQAAVAPVIPTTMPAAPTAPVLKDTESYFNQSIKAAVKAGDIDKALKLLQEAESLGSKTARETFIQAVKKEPKH